MRRTQPCTTEEMVLVAETDLVRRGRVAAGDVMGVVAGTQMASGSTNFLRLHVVTAEEDDAVAHSRRRK